MCVHNTRKKKKQSSARRRLKLDESSILASSRIGSPQQYPRYPGLGIEFRKLQLTTAHCRVLIEHHNFTNHNATNLVEECRIGVTQPRDAITAHGKLKLVRENSPVTTSPTSLPSSLDMNHYDQDEQFQAAPFNVHMDTGHTQMCDTGASGWSHQADTGSARLRSSRSGLRSEDISMDEADEGEYNRSVLRRMKISVDEVNITEEEVMEELEEVISLEEVEGDEDPLTLDTDHMNVRSSSSQVMEDEASMFAGNPDIQYPVKYINDKGVKRKRKTYKCWECPALQYSYEGYLSHKNGHMRQFPHKCPDCTFSCQTPHGITKHHGCHMPAHRRTQGKKRQSSLRPRLRLPRKKYRLPCSDPNCPWKAKDRPKLRWHVEEYHSIKRAFQCDMCTYSSDFNHLLRWHQDSHRSGATPNQSGGSVVNSSLAGFPSIRNNSIATKRKNSKNRALYRCKSANCPQIFTNSMNRVKHMRRHGSNEEFSCTSCNYASSIKRYLDRHMAWHEGDPNQLLLLQRQNRFNAVQAPATTATTPAAGRPLPTLRCEVPECPQKYSRLYDLKQHMKCHGGGFKYTCQICSFGSNARYAAWGHRRLHILQSSKIQRTKSVKSIRFRLQEQKKSRFAILSRPSATAGLISEAELAEIRAGNPRFNYKPYSMTSRGKRLRLNYKCLLCPTSFHGLELWKRHQTLHHGCQRFVDAYKCQMCSFATYRKDTLTAHYRKGIHGSSAPSSAKNPVQPPETQHKNPDGLLTLDGRAMTLDEDVELETQSAPKAPTSLNSMGRPEPQISESGGNVLKPTVQQLISKVKIVNFKAIDERVIKLNSNLYEVPGGTGKTTTIVACLVGLGYDVLHDLTSLGDLDLNDVVRHDEAEALVEVKLNLRDQNYRELRCKKYGPELKIKRKFQRGASVHDSPIEISYANIKGKSITRTQFKDLISSLIPEFASRVMVLNTENLQYLSDNFETCDNIFREIVKERKHKSSLSASQLAYQNEEFARDLASREQRISFLKASLKKRYPDNAKLRQLQVAHGIELKTALEQYNFVKETLEKIQLEQSIDEQIDHVANVLEKMRAPFCKFLQAQNYTGDLLLGGKEDGSQELIAWVKDSLTQPAPSTPEDAKTIWRGMSGGKKKLATLGLYVSFWRVLDSCPVMFSDAYSSCQFEFSFPRAALPVLIDVIHEREDSRGQFFMTLP